VISLGDEIVIYSKIMPGINFFYVWSTKKNNINFIKSIKNHGIQVYSKYFTADIDHQGMLQKLKVQDKNGTLLPLINSNTIAFQKANGIQSKIRFDSDYTLFSGPLRVLSITKQKITLPISNMARDVVSQEVLIKGDEHKKRLFGRNCHYHPVGQVYLHYPIKI